LETILLVDDEPTVLNFCQRILRLGGYAVIPAGNGIEALRLAHTSSEKIDLALLDLMMPGMNGVELGKHLQRENPYRIIWKPFKTESLLRMIENALGNSPE